LRAGNFFSTISLSFFSKRPGSGKPVEISREDGNILVLDGD
jgi:hypothetical protein